MHCKNLLQNQLKDCIAEKIFAETVLLTYVGCVAPAAPLFHLEPYTVVAHVCFRI